MFFNSYKKILTEMFSLSLPLLVSPHFIALFLVQGLCPTKISEFNYFNDGTSNLHFRPNNEFQLLNQDKLYQKVGFLKKSKLLLTEYCTEKTNQKTSRYFWLASRSKLGGSLLIHKNGICSASV